MELRGDDSVRWPCWEECLVAGRDCNILEWDIGEMVQMMIISVLDNPFCDPALKILKWDLSMKFEVTRSVFMRMKSACMNFVSALVFLLNVIFTFICLLYERCTQHVGSTFLFIVALYWPRYWLVWSCHRQPWLRAQCRRDNRQCLQTL